MRSLGTTRRGLTHTTSDLLVKRSTRRLKAMALRARRNGESLGPEPSTGSGARSRLPQYTGERSTVERRIVDQGSYVRPVCRLKLRRTGTLCFRTGKESQG